MKRLKDFIFVREFFKDIGITPNWLYALSVGTTEVYDDCLINYYIEDGFMIVNSTSINNKFNLRILKKLRRLIEDNENVIISSEVDSIQNHLFDKYNMLYNKEFKIYHKGV